MKATFFAAAERPDKIVMLLARAPGVRGRTWVAQMHGWDRWETLEVVATVPDDLVDLMAAPPCTCWAPALSGEIWTDLTNEWRSLVVCEGTALRAACAYGPDVLVVGDAGLRARVYTFHGVVQRMLDGRTENLRGLCVEGERAWAVGDGGALLAFDGEGWTAEDSATRADLRGVVRAKNFELIVGGVGEVRGRRAGEGWVSFGGVPEGAEVERIVGKPLVYLSLGDAGLFGISRGALVRPSEWPVAGLSRIGERAYAFAPDGRILILAPEGNFTAEVSINV